MISDIAEDELDETAALRAEVARLKARIGEIERTAPARLERFEAALAAAGMIGWEWYPGGDGIVPIGAVEALVDKAEAGSGRFDRVIHSDDRRRVLDTLATCLRSDEGLVEEFRIKLPDGREKWVSANGRMTKLADGRRVMAGIMTDITARKAAEDMLRAAHQRMDYALSAAGMVVWEWEPSTDAVEHTQDHNRNLPAGVGNRSDFQQLIHPDDRSRIAQAFEHSFREGTEYREEYRLQLPTGETRWIFSAGRPMVDSDGRRRMSGVMTDITARRAAEAALRDSEARLRAVFDTAPVGIVIAEAPSGRVVAGNRRTEEIFRHPIHMSPDLRSHGEWVSFHPDGRRVQGHEYPIGRILHEGAERAEAEVLYQRGDGTQAWVRLMGAPIKHDDQVIGAVVAILDIDEEKRAAEQQQMLMGELNHRVKNTLAVVQSLALQSRRSSATPDAFIASFAGRLQTLSAAHSLLTEESWQGAQLADVARRTLAPFKAATSGASRFEVAGPPVRLASSVALNLSMALHELATNALKYGALSVPRGRVIVSWQQNGEFVEVSWTERDGPAVVPPDRKGFGTRLIEQGVTRELGGEAAISYPADGVRCLIRLPVGEKVRLI